MTKLVFWGEVSLACSTLLLVGSFSSMTRAKLSADTFMHVRRQFRERSLLHSHSSFSQEFFLHIQCFFCGIESVALTTPQFLIREPLLHAPC